MSPPYLLELPHWLARRFDLPRLLAERSELSNAVARRWLEVFALSGPETAFARTVLSEKTNLWLYRCNQRRFCGDFVVVDMAAPLALRRAWVLELKRGAPVQPGAGGVQLAQAEDAVAELVRAAVLGPQPEIERLLGGAAAVLAWLQGAPQV